MVDIPLLIRDLVLFLLVALVVNLLSRKVEGTLHAGAGYCGPGHWFRRANARSPTLT